MTGAVDVMEAIRDLAAREIPELERIYLDLVPKGFLRPSLLIEAAALQSEPASHSLILAKHRYTLVAFDETDDYAHSDTRRLLRLQERVLNLFRAGYLEVGDRVLQVRASTGGRNWGEAYVDLAVEFYDAATETDSALPLMEQIDADIVLRKG